jgi:tagatose 6-phosphate kinase
VLEAVLAILTVTLNPTVDKTYYLDKITPGAVHHVKEAHTCPAGKGVNVARVILLLDPQVGLVSTTGFAGGYNGASIIEGLTNDGLNPDFVPIDQESRVCVALIDASTGKDTKINEKGPEVTDGDCDAFLRKLEHLAPKYEYIAFCGRTPPGARDTLYAEAIKIAQTAGAKAVLDTAEASLVEGLKALPAYCKINIHELSQAIGKPLETHKEAAKAAESWLDKGVEIIITFGGEGALWAGHPSIMAHPPIIKYLSAVGSGDAFLGGMLVGLNQRLSSIETLKLAVAAGSSAAEQMTVGALNPTTVELYRNQIEVMAF